MAGRWAIPLPASRIGAAAGRAGTARMDDPDRAELLAALPAMRRFAHALRKGEPAAAEDLLGDAIERALLKWHLFRPGTNRKSWLIAIVQNVNIDQRRREARQVRTVELRYPVDKLPVNSHSTDDPGAGLRLRDIVRALEALPRPQREVVQIAAFSDLTYEQMAREVGVPLGTIRSRLFRGREALRRAGF